jgi:RNA polymerase sigma factor (sigma-70 family)
MVWGVCRRTLRNLQDAEDAFQATFLVLVRKARSVRPRERVGNWLYGVAVRTARKANARAARRREHQVGTLPEVSRPSPAPADDVRRWLDVELARLPDNYRAAVVLCDLQGKTHQEAARQLGWPVGTLSTRLLRARARLARQLSRHEPALSAGAVALLLADEAAAGTPPADLLAAVAQVPGREVTGMISAEVVSLTKGVLHAMLLRKLTTIATASLMMAAGLGGASLLPLRLPGEAALPTGAVAHAQQLATPAQPAGARPLKLDVPIRLDVAAPPIKLAKSNYHILRVGAITFRLDKTDRLQATLRASATQQTNVDYRINVAVFDARGRLLGTAAHTEPVKYIRLGRAPTMARTIELDFGVSQDFRQATQFVVAVSNPEVPAMAGPPPPK